MELHEAIEKQQELRGTTPEPREEVGHAWDMDAFARCSPSEQRAYFEVMRTFITEGDPPHQTVAVGFLLSVPPPEDVVDELVEDYVSRGLTHRHPLATVLSQPRLDASDDALAKLRHRFVAMPADHASLAQVLLRREPDEATLWDAFAAMVSSSDDPQVLSEAFSGAYQAYRFDDYVDLLKEKSPSVIREVAARLPTGWGPQLLDGCGLEPVP